MRDAQRCMYREKDRGTERYNEREREMKKTEGVREPEGDREMDR